MALLDPFKGLLDYLQVKILHGGSQIDYSTDVAYWGAASVAMPVALHGLKPKPFTRDFRLDATA